MSENKTASKAYRADGEEEFVYDENSARDAIYHVLSGMEKWFGEETERTPDVLRKYEKAAAEAIAGKIEDEQISSNTADLAASALLGLDEAYADLDITPYQVYHENIRLGGDSIQNALDREADPEW